MPEKDLYRILGLTPAATADELKRAYRRLAQRCHPDVNRGRPEALVLFKKIREAYAILSDPVKRRQYDRLLKEARKKPGKGLGDIFSIGEKAGEIFDTLFGPPPSRAKRAPRGPRRGNDLSVTLETPFKTAVFGGEQPLEIEKEELCPNCDGRGALPGTPSARCPQCQGRGQAVTNRTTFGVSQTCPKCAGRGLLFENPCIVCHGSGHLLQRRQLQCTIPPGIESGRVIRLQGEGGAGVGDGPPGDLHVTIEVAPLENFWRIDDALSTCVELSLAQAVLGATVQVPTLETVAPLDIPPGTQPGAVFTLVGHGAPIGGSDARGDLDVVAKVKIPERLTPEQRQLFERFAHETGLQAD